MKLYVDINALPGGTGEKHRPFNRIGQAAAIAVPGDRVLVLPGVYREWVNPKNGGSGPDKAIVYRSKEKGAAVITGAELVKNWTLHQGTVWTARIPNGIFGSFNPYTTPVKGDWYFPSGAVTLGEVYLNGKAMYESPRLSEILDPKTDPLSWDPDFTRHRWCSVQEGDFTVLYGNFQGADPNAETVEINVRKYCFHPEKTGVNYITLSGFTVKQAATQWAPPTAYQEGMIGPHWSRGWVIEDCEVSDARCSGISLGKYLQPENENKWTTKYLKDGTQTEREAICQAQREGWTKENIGSHTVRRCHIHDCGQTGIVGHLGGVFSVIEDNHIHHINHRQELFGAEIGGIKMHAAIDVVFRRNHIHHCSRGLWLDWQAQGTRVTGNLFHDNHPPKGAEISNSFMLGEDLFVEVSHGPTLVDNNVFLSPIAGKLSTQGLAFVHNLIAGSFTAVGTGTDNGASRFPSPRYTPYHVPHRTEIAGFMTFLHGDARFYNNIFLQRPIPEAFQAMADRDRQRIEAAGEGEDSFANVPNLTCGTAPYDGYPTAQTYFSRFRPVPYDRMAALRREKEQGKAPDPVEMQQIMALFSSDKYYDHLPVYTGGNLYLDGAKPCDTELHFAENPEARVHLCLKEQEGSYLLETDLFDKLPRLETQTISTQLLGEAFEPEQPFENADGSPICFNEDYFGQHRSISPLPGPFSAGEDLKRPLAKHTPPSK